MSEKTTTTNIDENRDPVSIAVFADSRASITAIDSTFSRIFGSHKVEHVYLDPSTVVGQWCARRCQYDGIAYTIMRFRDSKDNPEVNDETSSIFQHAAEVLDMTIDDIPVIPASILIVPAAVGAGEDYLDRHLNKILIDLSPMTITGVICEMTQQAGRDMLVVDVPENGLCTDPKGDEFRRTFHVGFDPSAELPGEFIDEDLNVEIIPGEA